MFLFIFINKVALHYTAWYLLSTNLITYLGHLFCQRLRLSTIWSPLDTWTQYQCFLVLFSRKWQSGRSNVFLQKFLKSEFESNIWTRLNIFQYIDPHVWPVTAEFTPSLCKCNFRLGSHLLLFLSFLFRERKRNILIDCFCLRASEVTREDLNEQTLQTQIPSETIIG